ncbi:zinc-dependent metalloprotease [Corynebacterium glutamicum]|uniref:zinc-dependent metalloprotease n=1 Tax=Corynebacterium glutamicum TaxID=1718 RepID=UPI001C6E2D0D|nr:zinc-dependent metalloprotease [Corynebacterium glutamicum]QYR18257.1 zinc-dependent metalloprotease [Corynebacterium glutamicum]
MNSNGFGFSFGNNDDDDDKNRNNDPFGLFGGNFGFGGQGGAGGPGGLGDILNQFGQMLSGMGDSMNSPEAAGPVNYDLAARIARQQIGRVAPVKDSEKEAVEESLRLAELWLDNATQLPTSGHRVEAWNPENWLENTLPVWKRLVSPVAEQMNKAQLENLPEEAREMMGPMSSLMNSMSSMNFGVQLGNALGDLAKQTLTGSDFGLPISPVGVSAVLPGNIAEASKGLNVAPQEMLVYICAREAARQRLFKHVPWLVERLVSSVEEYAVGLEIDTSHIQEAMGNFQMDNPDPERLQEMMNELQGMDLSPRIGSRNANAVSRLETLLALVEGWVDIVVTQALSERIPSTDAMNEAWKRRRATGGSAEQAFSQVVGIELGAPKVSEAAELWRRVENAVGVERRDAVWNHPDFLPTAEDIDKPAEFIDALLGESDGEDFDPIAEITALEKLLAEEAEKKNDSEDYSEDDGSEGTSDKN